MSQLVNFNEYTVFKEYLEGNNRAVHVKKGTCLISLFNLTKGPRSDEWKQQICFLSLFGRYSDTCSSVEC